MSFNHLLNEILEKCGNKYSISGVGQKEVGNFIKAAKYLSKNDMDMLKEKSGEYIAVIDNSTKSIASLIKVHYGSKTVERPESEMRGAFTTRFKAVPISVNIAVFSTLPKYVNIPIDRLLLMTMILIAIEHKIPKFTMKTTDTYEVDFMRMLGFTKRQYNLFIFNVFDPQMIGNIKEQINNIFEHTNKLVCTNNKINLGKINIYLDNLVAKINSLKSAQAAKSPHPVSKATPTQAVSNATPTRPVSKATTTRKAFIDSSDDYQQKYMKYKAKYLQLKAQFIKY